MCGVSKCARRVNKQLTLKGIRVYTIFQNLISRVSMAFEKIYVIERLR